MSWKSVLTFSGLGAFAGFLLVVFSYAPFENELFLSAIPAGALIGAVAGKGRKIELRSSPVAFLLGVVVTLTLGLLWGKTGVESRTANALLMLVIATMLFVNPANVVDAVLSPMTYTGGSALILLLLKFYGPIQNVENGIHGVVVFSGRALVMTLLSALTRWGFEKFRRIGKDNA